MKVVVLIENNIYKPKSEDINLYSDTSYLEKLARLKKEHGLSLYIESGGSRILFDTGGSGAFLYNAKLLNIDINNVTKLILSHGHYDHTGGVADFLKENKKADIYVNKYTYGDYYSLLEDKTMKYIGMDKSTKDNPRIKTVGSNYKLDKGMYIVSGVIGTNFFPSGNQSMYSKIDSIYEKDDFSHEQNLIIVEGDKVFLFAGCAHNGILNIIFFVEKALNLKITHVFSGLHLYNRRTNKSEDPQIVNEIGKVFKEKNIALWTGHCTGEEAFFLLKKQLGDSLLSMSTGNIIEI